ncbi:AraC family transcriptional regulator [Sediminitomix flava]|uniref:AraC family transcriptional regulator n=2 Tax=Sediminitomix flava TaxID=379075 RepID=A0A315Z8R7_SEDFL|nr:AraC family transcriptional regulator [Sediminitomix flava]
MGAFQALMMTVFLLLSKSNRTPNSVLAVMSFSWAVCCLSFALQSNKVWWDYPHLFRVTSVFLYSFFPPIYLYTKYVTTSAKSFSNKDLLHFLPSLGFLLSGIPFYILSAEEKRQAIFDHHPEWMGSLLDVGSQVTSLVIVIQGLLYSFLSIKHLRRFNMKLKDVVSENDTMTFHWLRNLIIAVVIIWLLGSVGTFWDWILAEDSLVFFQLTYLSIVVLIYFISYNALRQPEIFKEIQLSEGEELVDVIIEDEKEEVIQEENEEMLANSKKLSVYIENKKPYLKTKLTLQELVDDLGFTRNQLSALIFYTYKAHFYDVMNEYRLEEAIALLKGDEYQDLKLEIIAYKAGFNTKATFNRLFKQKMGITPSEFRKKQRELHVELS